MNSSGHHRGSALRTGFGFAAGWMLFQFVAGVMAGLTTGLWRATAELSPGWRRAEVS